MSSTSNTSKSARNAASASAPDPTSWAPTAAITVSTIASPLVHTASGTKNAPSQRVAANSTAAARAIRVFPHPPTPVRVTNRDSSNAANTAST